MTMGHGPSGNSLPAYFLEAASTTGFPQFAVCLKVRRAQIIGHTAKKAFVVGQIQNTRPK